ncbi:MAG TPA: alpha/beta hydrolase-fold protein, partial [Pyrinomonadaceae bacterium]|nr:alpha/beta hydrolase-fold protein [Pyrinomonadaceae bacterium]
GVVLPRDYAKEASRRYPLRVHVGGYGAKYTGVQRLTRSGSDFIRAWLADDAPRFILLHLDGDGPFGDPYQVNSDNNGPYGDALTRELIPHVEQRFRAVGQPHARVLDGGSTGGWVSLALQIFYPDFFNGAWSFCPDGLDCRAFQLINVYEDRNAYVNSHGFERPSARDERGDTKFTVRHEAQMENVLGAGDSWAMSGEQWGAWNAVYGPRGSDGRPRPLWNPRTGEIDRSVGEHWKRYDLRLVLEQNWQTLAPRLRGKLRVWMGDADTYFLNNGVYLLEDFLARAAPAYEGKITYGPRQPHCWIPLGERELLDEMAARVAGSGR